MKKFLRLFLCSVFTLLVAHGAGAAIYEVGPGQPYPTIGSVPWATLTAGDTVLIHWQATPYREKWVINRPGTVVAPITVRGVPNGNGELPVIDGNGATTPAPLNFWGETRAVIKLGGSNVPNNPQPTYVVIESLDVRSARAPYTFRGDDSATYTYSDSAGAIWIEAGDHITIRNCILSDSSNGFFTSNASSNVLVEGCYIRDNGVSGSIYQHNIYTESATITYQFNRLGPLRAGCPGNNLKDRSANLVVRYNWLDGGARQLDLVDSEFLYTQPGYNRTYVYGNVLIEHPADGSRQIVHYGGDSGITGQYRKGYLHFYNNTVYSERTDATTLFRPQTDDERVDARNNIAYVTAAGSTLGIVEGAGVVEYRNNWLKTGYVANHGGGSVVDLGGNVTGASPAFLDETGQDFHLSGASACINAGTTLHADTLPLHDVVSEYVKHQQGAARGLDGTLDIGAYEATAGLPNAPTSLSATTVSSSAINLAWIDNATNESGFEIQRAPSATGTWAAIGTVSADVVAYPDTGLSPSTAYFYRVRAFNGSGTSGFPNTASATTFALPLPDLTVSAISVAPSVALPNTPASLTVTVSNIGTAGATAFRVDSWFARSATLTCGLTGSVTENVTSLAAGSSLTLVYPFTFSASYGSFTARAFADSQCVLTEGAEGNQGSFAYFVNGPDMTITALTVAPTYGPPGTLGSLTVTVKNKGSLGAGGFRLDSWFDRSANPPCASTGSVTENIASLGAGASLTFSYPFTFPTGFGNHNARAFADSQCVIAETFENNNTFTRTYVVSGPDVTITAMNITPPYGAPNTPATLSVTVKNQGTVAINSSFVLNSWFHRTANPACGNGASVTSNIASLAAGASLTFNYPFNFPAGTATYTARSMVDGTCVIAETSESNNIASKPYTIQGPDLTVVSVTITPTAAPPGTAGTMAVVVRNLGSLEAINAVLGNWFHRSANPACGNAASLSDTIPSLAAGASVTLVYPFNFGTLLGTNTARAFIDAPCAIGEMNESNNIATRNYAVQAPDLSVTSMTVAPSTGPAGTAGSLTVIIKNTSSLSVTSPFRLDSWFTRSTAPTCGQTGSATENIASLAAGASTTYVYPFTFSSGTIGTNYARAFVDSQCVINGETSETNNINYKSYIVSGPDFTLTAMSVAPISGPAGTLGTLTVTLKNQGTIAVTQSFRLDAWFTNVSTPTCGATGSVTEVIGSLGAGASLTLSYPFTFPSSAGTYTARGFGDSQCAIKEANENNNQRTTTYQATTTLAPQSQPAASNTGTPTVP
jgi:subtilase family serine protease